MKKQLHVAACAGILAFGLFANFPCYRAAVAQTGDSTAHGDSHGLTEELFRTGLEVAGGVRQLLPEPRSLSNEAPGRPGQELQKLSARQGWDRFSRDSVMAPVHVEIQSINDASGKRIGHQLYSAFIAYLDLALIEDRDWMESLFRIEQDSQDNQDSHASSAILPQDLPREILNRLGLQPLDGSEENLRVVNLPLLNRVTVRGVVQFEVVRSKERVLFAWKLDPRFTPDSISADGFDQDLLPFINHYVKADRDDLGRTREATPVPYDGMGGYMSIRPTGLEENQHLVETRMLLHEPDDWFAGSNFLRSKFPTLLQESGQTFRRKLNR